MGRLDTGDLDGLLALCEEDFVFDTTRMRDWPEPEYKGHTGFRRFLTEWLDVWEGFEVGVDELIPAGDGRVGSLFWQRGKGRQSSSGLRQTTSVRRVVMRTKDNEHTRSGPAFDSVTRDVCEVCNNGWNAP